MNGEVTGLAVMVTGGARSSVCTCVCCLERDGEREGERERGREGGREGRTERGRDGESKGRGERERARVSPLTEVRSSQYCVREKKMERTKVAR